MEPTEQKIEIILAETLAEHWAVWFEGITLTRLPDGNTRLSGSIPDHATLHGYLERIRDLNLKLISVHVEKK